MKKLSVFSTLTFTSLFLLSCSQMHRQMKKAPSQELNTLVNEDLKEDEIFEKNPKTGEYTHVIAEADAADVEIKKEVGVSEIDEELPGSDPVGVPYAKNFLANKNTQRMQYWVEYFTKKERARFQRFINNGQEYRHHIELIFKEHGLPKELYFVGLIESGYYLSARSHAAAVGPWQFVRGTGKQYGLKISNEIDERQDLFKATHSAARYFKNLHNIFSSWELALSAYNAGEYGIIRRIMKHGTRDFYVLSKNKQLPSETINYVPKVLAAMHVVNNAEKYGFIIPRKQTRLFDRTELRATKKNLQLSTIAQRLAISTTLLRKLNPELRTNKTPRVFAGTYYLRVPKSKYNYSLDSVEAENSATVAMIRRPETTKEIKRRTALILDEEVKVEATVKRAQFHKVRRGETFVSIARKYKMSARELAVANGFKTWRTKVKSGDTLALSLETDTVKTVKAAAVPSIRMTNRPIVYRVRKGDNLTDLARIFNLELGKLKVANKIKRGQIMVGQRIVLPNTQKGIYTVKRGDHLTKVARDLRQPIEVLVKLNSLKRKTIYPGQKIIVDVD